MESVPNSRSEGASSSCAGKPTAPPLSMCRWFLGRWHQPERRLGLDQSSADQGKGGMRPAESLLTTHPTCVCFGGWDLHPHSRPWQLREVPHRHPRAQTEGLCVEQKAAVCTSAGPGLCAEVPRSPGHPCKGPLFLPSVTAR